MQNNYNQSYQNQYNPSQFQGKKHNMTYILVHIISIIAIIVVLYFLLTKDKNDYKEAVDSFCNGLNNSDYSEIEKILPQELRDSEDIVPFKRFVENLKTIEKTENADFSVTCKINKSKKIESEEVEDLSENYQYDYNTDSIITEAYEVNFSYEMKMEYEGKENSTEKDMTVIVGKIKGKWYFIDF